MSSKSGTSLASVVRGERIARVWSQEELSELAGVSLRTIQRIESGQPCSRDTIKALASVLEIDSALLLQSAPAVVYERTWFGVSSPIAVWLGAILCLPALLFVAVNIAYYQLNMVGLVSLIESPVWAAINSSVLTPMLVFGGPAAALFMNTPHVISLRARNIPSISAASTIIEGVVLRWNLKQWCVLFLAASLLTVMLIYGALENLNHMING